MYFLQNLEEIALNFCNGRLPTISELFKEQTSEDLALEKVSRLYNNGLLTNWEEKRYDCGKEIWCVYNEIKILFAYTFLEYTCTLKIYFPEKNNNISICSAKTLKLFKKIEKDIENRKLDAFLNS